MKTIEVKSLSNFITQIELLGLFTDLVIFRGQPLKGNLIPNIARKDKKLDTTFVEKELLEQLELMGASFCEPTKTNKLELLVLAQHFGLKTRLLDWTSNPLAALWFSCREIHKVETDCYVYALEAEDLLIRNVYNEDPFVTSKTRVFQPRLNNPRIIAQHGWFTLHRYSKKAKSFVTLESNKEIKGFLTEFVVKKENKLKILNSLDRHGISQRTLFPDLEGLCAYLNWRHDI